MVVLTIELRVDGDRQDAVRDNFTRRFLPTVSRRDGFVDAILASALEEPDRMLILLFFESEEQRMAWVSSPEHDPVWESIASQCRNVTPVSHEILARAGR